MKKLLFLFFIVSLLLISGCGKKEEASADPTPTTKPASIHSLDAGRRTAVEVALKNDIELASAAIKVEVVNYTVTLKGNVDTEEQKAKAEEIASGIKGVSKVNNELTVGP